MFQWIQNYTTISILTALVAKPVGDYSTVYELHPPPVSKNDTEGLENLSMYIYLPKDFEVPIKPTLLSNTSYVAENVTVYEWSPLLGAYVLRNKTVLTNIVTYLPTANITFVNSTSFINVANVTGFADARIDAVKTGEVVCGNTTAYFTRI